MNVYETLEAVLYKLKLEIPHYTILTEYLLYTCHITKSLNSFTILQPDQVEYSLVPLGYDN